MSKVYSFIWNEMATSEQKIVENLQSEAFIFVPYSSCSTPKDVVLGAFLSPQEVYWHDVTGCVDQINTICARGNLEAFKSPFRRFICNIYPGLQNFFVDACGVNEIPPLRDYLLLLLQLSANALPSEVANAVFKVFLIWNDGLKSGSLAPDDVEYLKGRLLKMEFTVLPTVRNKWVSLHSTFGLVCWCDDEELSKEFKDFNNLESLYFGEHGDKENETVCAKVSILMQKLGIPALSEIVTCEAIYYGLGDCYSKTSLVNWALPYAQRYIYNMYPDRYIQLKQTGFEILQHLQIVVVDELFYRNVIKRGIASKKRFQCNCLLQGNVLYIARESDSHSIFMELSGSLVDRAPKIHLANFLHLITTMAESGSTEEQTELFILNKQQVQKLPHEESIWSLPALPSSALVEKTPMAAFVSTAIDDPKPSNRKKSKIYSNWPPANWKTAPDFGEKNNFSLGTNVVYDSVDTIVAPNEPNSGSTNFSDRTVVAPDEPSSSSTNFSNRDQLSLGTANAKQAMLTGRLGEYLAYEYFVRKVGEALVKWVNESTETGLPYDIVVGDDEENREYIEVKTTESVSKDWFSISQREWQYAVSKGESFSIARVVLVGSNLDRVTIYKNPARLCKLGQLQLAIVMPKQEKESPEGNESAGTTTRRSAAATAATVTTTAAAAATAIIGDASTAASFSFTAVGLGNIAYVLTIPKLIMDEAADEAIKQTATKQKQKWEEDDTYCKGCILGGLSDTLYDVYEIKYENNSAKELWDDLDNKYKMEDAGNKKIPNQ
ncbi:hypothetical protein RJ639_045832 [Escallonia herrerae]|uniref:Protein NO VEIN C-terminal domain-containing protein n=1 Tax=Escallonia herrerae TaxID=1293975 RepID=A0AA88W5U8_9ASTE|nr:hypothetical protein RJ639_045832 [Escallonia herrerae]